MNTPELINYKEAAQLAGYTPNSFRAMVKKTAPFPRYLIGHKLMYNKSDIVAWIETKKIEQVIF